MIMNHEPLMSDLAYVIFHEDDDSPLNGKNGSPAARLKLSNTPRPSPGLRAFIPPPDSLESQLEASGIIKDNYNLMQKLQQISRNRSKRNSTFYVTDADFKKFEADETSKSPSVKSLEVSSEETSQKEEVESPSAEHSESEYESATEGTAQETPKTSSETDNKSFETVAKAESEKNRKILYEGSKDNFPKRDFLKSIFSAMACNEEDSETFFALCFFYAVLKNQGLDKEILRNVGIALPQDSTNYNDELMETLINILEQGSRDGSNVRLVTLEMAIRVIILLSINEKKSRLKDFHMAMIESVREASTLQLRKFYKADEIFLDMFENEYHQMKSKPINVQYVMMDASLLLPPTATPLTGIEFSKRLPCGEEERARRAVRIFLLLRELCLLIRNEPELLLPLSKVENPVKEDDVLDLNNSDLIACTVLTSSRTTPEVSSKLYVVEIRQHLRRFLVIDTNQFILVEPDTSKLGWGVVKFVALLQDVEATADKDDSRSLNITVHRPFAARSQSAVNPLPVLSAKFIFDDYIRCMSARQRLQRRGAALRHRKMTTLACLLELPVMAAPPSHYYALAPFNSGSQGYVWSPSPRSYTVRSTGSSGSVSPKSDTTSPPRPPQPKSKFISPKHSKILQEKQERVKTSKTTQAEQENTNVVTLDPLGVNKKPSSGSSESYMRPMTMDTPPPKNLKPKPSQAQALASVLGEGIEIDEIEATEDLTDMRFQMLTIDDAEEASEELSSDEGNSPDNTDFPRRKVRKRRSTGGSVGSPKRDSLLSEETSAPEVRQIRSSRSSDPVSLSAPPTPTGQRRSKSHTVKRKNSTSDSNARVKSLPAISLHYTRGLLRKKSTQRTRTKPKPHRPRVVSVRTAPRKQPPS